MKSLKILTTTLFATIIMWQIGYSADCPKPGLLPGQDAIPQEQEKKVPEVTEEQLDSAVQDLIMTPGFREAISKGLCYARFFRGKQIKFYERELVYINREYALREDVKGIRVRNVAYILPNRASFLNYFLGGLKRKNRIANPKIRDIVGSAIRNGTLNNYVDLTEFVGIHLEYLSLSIKKKYLDFIDVFQRGDKSEFASQTRKAFAIYHDLEKKIMIDRKKSGDIDLEESDDNEDGEYYLLSKHQESEPQPIPDFEPLDIPEPVEYLARRDKLNQAEKKLNEILDKIKNLEADALENLEGDLLEEIILQDPNDIAKVNKILKELDYIESENPEDQIEQKRNVKEFVHLANILDRTNTMDRTGCRFGYRKITPEGEFKFNDIYGIYCKAIYKLSVIYDAQCHKLKEEYDKAKEEYDEFTSRNPRLPVLSPVLQLLIPKRMDEE